MGTFLTNRKMSPALAQRILVSVRGRSGSSSALVRSMLRLAVVLVVLGLPAMIFQQRRQNALQLEHQRNALLDALHTASGALTEDDRLAVAKDEAWLIGMAGGYAGDLVSQDLHVPGAMRALTTRTAVYVHGPLSDFTSTAGIAKAAGASYKDSFLACLVDPPVARTEAAILPKVRAAYADAALLERKTAHVHDLRDAQAGVKVVQPAWEERVRKAHEPMELTVLRAEFDRVPLEKSTQALRANVLVVVMDEPSPRHGPAELDGERPHDVRVAIVDLVSKTLVLRMRKHVDPSGWSEVPRAEFASGLDGCALAFDVHAAATPGRDASTE